MPVVRKTGNTQNKKKERYTKEFNFVAVKLYPSQDIEAEKVSENVGLNTYEKVRFEIDEQIEVPDLQNEGQKTMINDGINCWFKPAIKYDDLPAQIMNLYTKTESGEKVKAKAQYYISFKPDKENPEKSIALKRTTLGDLKEWSIVGEVSEPKPSEEKKVEMEESTIKG